jgi:hypothetical protein
MMWKEVWDDGIGGRRGCGWIVFGVVLIVKLRIENVEGEDVIGRC